MQADEYNEWEQYTLHLSPEEIANPLLVLKDFFNDDWLPDQLERLKMWRDHILKDDFYRGRKNSPAELLYFHKFNICLIEAIHIMKVHAPSVKMKSDDLAQERRSWRDYPVHLTDAELSDPHLVINEFFDAFDLPAYRRHLYSWLEYGLSAKGANEFLEADSIVQVYENLQKIYSAAWLIHQRNSTSPYLRCSPYTLPKRNLVDEAVEVYKLNCVIPTVYKDLISDIIAVIKRKVPSVQGVIYLGVSPTHADRIYLLVLTSGDEQAKAQSLSCTIEDSCKELTQVTALVHHASELFTAWENDNRFFNEALHCPVIYLSGELLLPIPKLLNRKAGNEAATVKWLHWYNQGRGFLNGGEFYLQQGDRNAALFSLHQCAECVMIALIRVALGYKINNHNLSRLLSITEMFTSDIRAVFYITNTKRAAHFETLKQAYINVRYKDDYQAEFITVKEIFSVVQDFVIVAEKVYARHSLTNGF
ncbi:MAG: HEPN domain-containing protein [Sphingobacteriales bacterium]|nr:MAG: HEPN domain-containing protein [Sphingobacteriales bacterium]